MRESPYLKIAREHLTIEELERLLAEKNRPKPETMTEQQKKANYYKEYFDKHIKK